MAIMFKVFDHDDVGSDDHLGSAIVPVKDTMVHNWFPLTVGDKSYGGVQIAAGFGGIACPAKIPPFRKVQLNVESARHLPAKDRNLAGRAKSDPYVTLSWRSSETQPWVDAQASTSVMKDTLKPVWHEQFVLSIGIGESMQVKLHVFDKDTVGADDSLGYTILSLPSNAEVGSYQHGWCELEGGSGSIQAAFGLAPFAAPTPLPVSVTVPVQVDIERARGIVAADAGNLFVGKKGRSSDPYVRIFWRSDDNCPWEDSGFKTTVKVKTLTPKWGECFTFDCEGGAHIQVKLELYDHDKLTSDDCLGYIIYELNDAMPYSKGWHSFKGGTGELDAFVRIAGCGPAPLPRVNAKVTLTSGHDLLPTDTDLLGRKSADPYVTIAWRPNAESPWVDVLYKSEVAANTLDPVWNETVDIPNVVRTDETAFKFTVYDSDLLSKDDVIGELVLLPGWEATVGGDTTQFELLPPGLHETNVTQVAVDLLDKHDEGNRGYLRLTLALPLPALPSPDVAPGVICGHGAEIERIAAHVAVHRARGLTPPEGRERADPFFRLHWRGTVGENFEDLGPEYESRFIANTVAPQFKYNGSFEVEQLKGMALLVELFSFSYEGKDHFLGECVVEIGFGVHPVTGWFPVTLAGRSAGEVEVTVSLLAVGAGFVLPTEAAPWFLDAV